MWYISYLIRYAEVIRLDFTEEDQVLSDLIQLEVEIKKLINREVISRKEKNIINYYMYSVPLDKLYNRAYLYDMFVDICKKLEKELHYFSDDSFIKRMREEYCLNKKQETTIRSYLKQTIKSETI